MFRGWKLAACLCAPCALLGVVPARAAYNPSTIVSVGTFSTVTSGNFGQYPAINIAGRWVANDGGGGNFNKNGTSCTPDGGTIIKDAGGNCFFRVDTGNGVVKAKWFGYYGDGTSHPISALYTLAAAKAIYQKNGVSWVISTSDEFDEVALAAAIFNVSPHVTLPDAATDTLMQYGGTVIVPVGLGLINETVYLNPHVSIDGAGGLQTYTGPTGCSTLTNPGTSALCWTGGTYPGIVLDATGFYQTLKPAFSGSATGGSATTITFNASAISGIGASTFVGSVVTIGSGSGSTNSPRLIISGAYSAPTYTATVQDPWDLGVPDNTSVISMPAIAVGDRFTAVEGLSGTNNFNGSSEPKVTLTPGVRIDALTILTDTTGYACVRMNGAGSFVVRGLTCSGFNTSFYTNASYYGHLSDSNFKSTMFGVAATNDNWLFADNVSSLPVFNGSDVYRPSTTNRPWWIGQTALNSQDPDPYLNTGFYCYAASAGIIQWTFGDVGEQMDRGAFLACSNAVFSGANIEGIGGASQQAGNAGLFDNGTYMSWFGGNFGQAASRASNNPVPMFAGVTPNLIIKGLTRQAGTAGYGPVLGGFNFSSGGQVRLEDAQPGPAAHGGDVAPESVPIYWDSFPQHMVNVTATGNYGLSQYDLGAGKNFAGGSTFFLPFPVPVAGIQLTVADWFGDAATNHMIVNGNGANINQSSTYVISTNNGAVTVQSDGSNWRIVSSH